MKKTFYVGLIGMAVVMGFVLAGCGSSPETVSAPAAPAAPAASATSATSAASAASTTPAAPAAKTDYSSSWLTGKWLSLSTGFVDELILAKDGTGTSTLFNGNGEAEMAIKLTFDPEVDFFSFDPVPESGITLPVRYSRSEDGRRLTVDMPEAEGMIYARGEQLINEVCEGNDITAILRLGNYYSVAGDANCIPLFTEAVKRGSSDGNLNLGNYYYRTDKAKAFEYYLAGAGQGNPQAEFNVFVFYYNGEGGIQQDSTKAIEWLLLAAEHGSADALNVLKQLGAEL